MVQHKFTHRDVRYVAESELVDTDYGPENRVVIYREEDPEVRETWQEAASIYTIVGWFQESVDEYENHRHQCDWFGCEQDAVLTCLKSGLALCKDCGSNHL